MKYLNLIIITLLLSGCITTGTQQPLPNENFNKSLLLKNPTWYHGGGDVWCEKEIRQGGTHPICYNDKGELT